MLLAVLHFICIFADILGGILYFPVRLKEYSIAYRKPVLLCVGRAGLCCINDSFHIF